MSEYVIIEREGKLHVYFGHPALIIDEDSQSKCLIPTSCSSCPYRIECEEVHAKYVVNGKLFDEKKREG